MRTLTSTLSHSSTIPSSQPQKMRLPGDIRTSLKAVRTSATTHLARKIEKAKSHSPERFYQDHIIAIFMGLFFETAMGPVLGALGIYLHGLWVK